MENKVFVAALGGGAAGISLAAILGTDKAKQIVDSVSSNAREIGGSLNNKINEAKSRSPRKTSCLNDIILISFSSMIN